MTVATECDNIAALHSHLPEAMAFDCDDKELFYENLTKADVVLIGPGLGENSKAEVVFQMVLEHISEHQILIIDGSALNLLAKAKPITVKTNHLILTPHQKNGKDYQESLFRTRQSKTPKQLCKNFQNRPF